MFRLCREEQLEEGQHSPWAGEVEVRGLGMPAIPCNRLGMRDAGKNQRPVSALVCFGMLSRCVSILSKV